jgi:hypothetical protein
MQAVYAEHCPDGCLSVKEALQLAAAWTYVDAWTVDSMTEEEKAKYQERHLSEEPRSLPWKAVKFEDGILTSDAQVVPMTKMCYLRRRDDRLGSPAEGSACDDRAAHIRVGCPVFQLQHRQTTNRSRRLMTWRGTDILRRRKTTGCRWRGPSGGATFPETPASRTFSTNGVIGRIPVLCMR